MKFRMLMGFIILDAVCVVGMAVTDLLPFALVGIASGIVTFILVLKKPRAKRT